MKKSLTDTQLRVLEKQAITCQDVDTLLCDYADSELTVTLRARLDAHVNGCPECRENRDSYRMVSELAAEIEDKPVPQDVQSRLHKALNARLGLNLPE